MYCAKCGSQVSQGLNYCNACGAKLTKEETVKDEANQTLTHLIAGLVVFGGAGFLFLVGLIAVLFEKNANPGFMTLIVGLYLLIVASVSFALLRLIYRVVNDQLETRKEEKRAAQLIAAEAPQLQAPREPAVSVTDRTTRTLEEALVKER